MHGFLMELNEKFTWKMLNVYALSKGMLYMSCGGDASHGNAKSRRNTMFQ